MNTSTCLFALLLLLSASCSPGNENKSSISRTPPIDSNLLTWTKSIQVFHLNKNRTDSNLVCEQWYRGDSLLEKKGKFYYRLPFESEYLNQWAIDRAAGKRLYETYDSLLCETGGSAAWNRYKYTYDGQKRPLVVKHYSAWKEILDAEGELVEQTRPQFVLSETISFHYSQNALLQITKNDLGKEIERIRRHFDSNKRLVCEEYTGYADERYAVYYTYQ